MDGLIYFQAGKLIAESGDARIYKMNNELFLELGKGHNLWALESELEDYIVQLHDKPHGDCLEIGLGLGVASKYILSCPKVKSLTTVEINEDVINVQKKANPIDKNWEHYSPCISHTVLNVDGLIYMYQTDKKYDFIFIDCYDRIDEDTIPMITDMVQAGKTILKDDGEIIGWFDKYTPENLAKLFQSLF